MVLWLEFCGAGLTVLVAVLLVHGRAVRLTTRQLEAAMPSGEEIRATEDHLAAAARVELKMAIHKLMEDRLTFKEFCRRGAEVVRQVLVLTEDKILGRGTREGLASRLVEQSRLFNQSELELKRLRREIEIARKAEYDSHISRIEMDARVQNFKAENARLQAMLDRANGERVRLSFELGRLAKDSRVA
jgi:hypothetical protein